MKLYIYRVFENEEVPIDVPHVIVHESVTIIKELASSHCEDIVSIIMDENVKRIEHNAFQCSYALRFVQLSRILEYIGVDAFYHCRSLEALFLPLIVKSIEGGAFYSCRSLGLLVLPHDIGINNVVYMTIYDMGVQQISGNAGVEEYTAAVSNRLLNEWLIHSTKFVTTLPLQPNNSITTSISTAMIHLWLSILFMA